MTTLSTLTHVHCISSAFRAVALSNFYKDSSAVEDGIDSILFSCVLAYNPSHMLGGLVINVVKSSTPAKGKSN